MILLLLRIAQQSYALRRVAPRRRTSARLFASSQYYGAAHRSALPRSAAQRSVEPLLGNWERFIFCLRAAEHRFASQRRADLRFVELASGN